MDKIVHVNDKNLTASILLEGDLLATVRRSPQLFLWTLPRPTKAATEACYLYQREQNECLRRNRSRVGLSCTTGKVCTLQ
mmetsp:Transcript_48191/g.76177  ORF Transcript_48191/g.76177 Transcript_48191/m.76177 type:complete len:80 (-) Transcript_48191:761-1000(-)